MAMSLRTSCSSARRDAVPADPAVPRCALLHDKPSSAASLPALVLISLLHHSTPTETSSRQCRSMQACTWPAVRSGRCLAASSATGQPSGAAVAQPAAFRVRFVQRVAEPHDAARAAAVRQPKHLHARGPAAGGSGSCAEEVANAPAQGWGKRLRLHAGG